MSAETANIPKVTEIAKEDEELSGEILQLIGQRIAPERVPAQAIHKDLVVRIEEMIKNGFPMEEKKKFIQKFSPPSNWIFIDPPKLDLEIKSCLQEAVLKRDSRIAEKQEKIAAGIVGLVSLMTTILKLNAEEKLSMVEKLSGIIRIFSDVQHEESAVRRSLIMKNINVSLRDTLTLASPDEWLFGNNLDEKIKATKTLESFSKKLKPLKFNQPKPESSKNWRGPPRRYYPSQYNYRQNFRMSGGRKLATALEERKQRKDVPLKKSYRQKKRD